MLKVFVSHFFLTKLYNLGTKTKKKFVAYLLGIFQGSTWHSIEVQDKGGHERGLEGEDGDGVCEDHAVGEILADDQGRR